MYGLYQLIFWNKFNSTTKNTGVNSFRMLMHFLKKNSFNLNIKKHIYSTFCWCEVGPNFVEHNNARQFWLEIFKNIKILEQDFWVQFTRFHTFLFQAINYHVYFRLVKMKSYYFIQIESFDKVGFFLTSPIYLQALIKYCFCQISCGTQLCIAN